MKLKKNMTHCHNERTELPYKGVSKNRCQISVSPISTCSLPRIKECFKNIFKWGGQVGSWRERKSRKVGSLKEREAEK